MKKIETKYDEILNCGRHITISKSEETKDHFSVYEFGGPCSGVLKHWGSKQELINELKEIIDKLEEF